MERFSFNENFFDPLVEAQKLADQKIAAYQAAQEVHVLESDGITSLLHIIVGHALPFI
jgi:hypothetical protein